MKRFFIVVVFIPALCLAQEKVKTIEAKTAPGAIQISLEEPSMMMTESFEDKNGMIFVPEGFFDMGSNDSVAARSGIPVPVHTVWVDGFWMDKTEVTNKNYCEFLNAWGKTTDASGNEMINLSGSWKDEKCRISQSGSRFSVETGYENHPVICVTWYGASQYAEWAGKRLPTEAEWEYAARAGSKQLKHSWGNGEPVGKNGGNIADISAKRVFSHWTVWERYDDGFVYTAPVGSFEPNPFGLFDMTGNVWEWCADWLDIDYYSNSPERNPQGPSSGTRRVVRGGSWAFNPGSEYCSTRWGDPPSNKGVQLGFRCARNN